MLACPNDKSTKLYRSLCIASHSPQIRLPLYVHFCLLIVPFAQVLVGGSTRIPKVRALLKDFFNGKEPNQQV